MPRSPSPAVVASAFSPLSPSIIPPYDMNPLTCNRADYTRALCRLPPPSSTSPAWLTLVISLRDLYTALGFHPAMTPNLSQTFSTPAANKNRIYFLWDFVGRTLRMLYLVPANLIRDVAEKHREEGFEAVLSRCLLTVGLIMDEDPGRLDRMTEETYPEQKGKHPNFGHEVEEATEELEWVLEQLALESWRGKMREAEGYR